MSKVKLLELDDLCKYYTSKGQLRKGIKKAYHMQTNPFIVIEKEKDFIKNLKRWNINISKLLGVYIDKDLRWGYCIYYK